MLLVSSHNENLFVKQKKVTEKWEQFKSIDVNKKQVEKQKISRRRFEKIV